MKTIVIMTSFRGPRSLENFIKIAPPDVDFVILTKEKLDKKYERTIEFHEKDVFAKSWIFNKTTLRSFGFLYAYQQKYDYIITVDDDCFPLSDSFFDDHIKRLQQVSDDNFNVLKAYTNIPENVLKYGCRGHPTKSSRKHAVVVNQGLWLGDLDLPAQTIYDLNSKDGKIPPPISTESKVLYDFVLPKGQLATVCAMNLSFVREVVPGFYWIYQDVDGFGINRYDDIWAGLFMKTILDKLEKRMSLGLPVIKHDKGPRTIDADVAYEARGEILNNFLWNNLSNLVLEGKDYATCFLEIADWLKKSSDKPDLKYFEVVSRAMHDWIKLFDKKLV